MGMSRHACRHWALQKATGRDVDVAAAEQHPDAGAGQNRIAAGEERRQRDGRTRLDDDLEPPP